MIISPAYLNAPDPPPTSPRGMHLPDEVLQNPALLQGWRQPVGKVKLNEQHPYMENLVAAWGMWDSSGGFIRDYGPYKLHGYQNAITGMAASAKGGYGRGIHNDADPSNSRIDLGSVSSDHPLSCSNGDGVSVLVFGYVPNSTECGNTAPRIVDKGNGSNATSGWGLAYSLSDSKLYFMRNGTGYASPTGFSALSRVHCSGIAMATGDMNYFADGRSLGTAANSWTIPTTTVQAQLFNWYSSDRQLRGGPTYLIMVWNKRVPDDWMYDLTINPYSMFVPV